jgi:predicted RNA-binding Zn ribbon-like protein
MVTTEFQPVASEPQPGGRRPAPGALGLVQSFVNSRWDLTRELEEQLGAPADLARWLRDHHLLTRSARLGEADLTRALEVREGLRTLLFAHNGALADEEAIGRLNGALGITLGVEFRPDGAPEFSPHGRSLDGALASIATIVTVAQIDGTWSRLKACPGLHCGWAFYDHSRNQSGSWCSMSKCGSRSKAREYRRRHRAASRR